MNENKITHCMPSETVWAKGTVRFPHLDNQNSTVGIPKSPHAVLPQRLYGCSNINCVAPFVAPPVSSKPEVVSFNNLTASHDVSKSSINAKRGVHDHSALESNFANSRPLQMCNTQQVDGTYYYPNFNKTSSSQFHVESSLSNTKQAVSFTPNVPQHEFRTGNHFISPDFNTTVNSFKNVVSSPIPNFHISAPQSSHIINGFSSSESQPAANYVNPNVSCPQSSSIKVPSDNSEILKSNYNNWTQSCPGVPPAVIPPEKPVHNPSFHVSCSPSVRCVNPQTQTNTCVAPYNHITPNFSVLANKVAKSSDIGQSMQYRYPPPVISKANSVGHNTFCDIVPAQQSLFHPNISFPPPPAFPHGMYPAHPIPPMPMNYPVISNFCNIAEVPKFKSEKERMLLEFLQKFQCNKKTERKSNLTVVEFRSALKIGLSLSKMLQINKSNLGKLLQSEEDIWNSEMENISNMQNQLADICSMVSNSDNLFLMQKKIKFINRKRVQRKKQKQKALSAKMKAEQNRKFINQEIDKWLDCIKEKNLKLKREAEMKKEADNILAEVRKKIQEAKRTIEKIKVFEKLRNARQANAIKKSLFVLPEHNEKFEKKVSVLKETMLKQLADYEAEENALKVMLETEQEGQLEEEAVWRIKKIKSLQQKKQKNIYECLFEDSEEPSPEDPLYLFYKYQDSANSSIENLVQIRHHWDVHLTEDGESIPQQWIIPVPPSNTSWEVLGDMIS